MPAYALLFLMAFSAAAVCRYDCCHPCPGLLHGENPDWVTSFVAAAGQRFESELAAGQVDGPRLLLRLFACLSRASVLHHADVLGLLQRLVDVAAGLAAAGGAHMWLRCCSSVSYNALCMCITIGACRKLLYTAYHICIRLHVKSRASHHLFGCCGWFQHEQTLVNMCVRVWLLAGGDPSVLTWQPWSDQLVYMVLGALVWGGLALQEGCPAEHSSLLEAVSSYMAARPMQVRI
jgi:hypothetical protein